MSPLVLAEFDYLIAKRFGALRLGLTDAVNVVLASQYRTDAIVTLDRRHFRAVAPLQEDSEAFRLLPEDGLDRPRDQHQ